MKKAKFHLTLGKSAGVARPPGAKRPLPKVTRVKPLVQAAVVGRALKATRGAAAILKLEPKLANAALWTPIACFCVCQKTGTAAYLDLWNTGHFDFVTDMRRCLQDCRAWFSADGYSYWGSPQTKLGRVNCYFRAPQQGTYVCNAQLQSDGGPAQVECLIDSFSFGLLPFNGLINQPHTRILGAGYHSFRIRQMTGAFFFLSLIVWQV